MSNRCKMDGGKYYNRVQAGSFEHRCMAAALRVQYGPGWVDPVLSKLGIQSQTLSTFAARRKRKHDKDNARKVLHKYKKQTLDSKHQPSSSSPDSSYGSLAADPGPLQLDFVENIWIG